MRFSSLEDTISPDNHVLIDVFVELLDISKLDFAVKMLKIEGRPSFNSKVFLNFQRLKQRNRYRLNERFYSHLKR